MAATGVIQIGRTIADRVDVRADSAPRVKHRRRPLAQRIDNRLLPTGGKKWGGRKVGTRISLTMEKEALVQQLHAQGQAIAAIARLVGLSRKSVYKALEPTKKVA